MKHITQIKSIGIKKQNHMILLQPVSIITGDNATGKTSVINAVQIALLGYVPSLGKQPGKTITLAPATCDHMEAEATYSDGTATTRKFKRTATGATVKETGAEPKVAEAQVDFSSFLAAKPTERHQILSSLMGEIDTREIQAQMTLKIAELGLGSFNFNFILPQPGINPITALADKVGEQGKFVKQSVDQARKTLATLVAVEVPSTPSMDKLAKAKGEYETSLNRLGSAQQALDSLLSRATKSPVAEPEESEPSASDIVLAEKELASLTQELKAAREQLQTAQAASWAAENRLETIRQRTMQEAQLLPEGPEPTVEEMDEVALLLDASKAEVSGLHSSLDVVHAECERLENSINTITELGKCPCCGSEGDHLQVALDKLNAAHADSTQKIEAWTQMLQKAEQTCNERGAKLTALTFAHTAWEAYRKSQAESPTPAEAKAAEVAAQAAAKFLQKVESRIIELEAEIEDCHRIRQAAAAWTSFRLATQNQPSEAEIEQARENFAHAQQVKTQAQEGYEAMKQEQDAYNRAVADQQRISDLTKEADTNEATAKNLAEFKKWLQGVERKATAAAMAPVLEISAVFLKDIVEGSLAIREHQLGIERDGHFLPLEVLSGMETAAVAAACQAMMAKDSDVPTIVVDELGRMRDKQALQFLSNCQAAVDAGVVGQVILVDPHGSRYPQELVIEIVSNTAP